MATVNITNNEASVTLNANTPDAVSDVIDLNGFANVGWVIQAKTGTHENHTIVLQVSADETTFYDYYRLTGTEGHGEKVIPYKYIRFCVHTTEGMSSTVDIVVNAK